MKATGLHFLSEHFIDNTPPVAQFDTSASTINSLSKSSATERVQKGIAHWDKQDNDVPAPNCMLKV